MQQLLPIRAGLILLGLTLFAVSGMAQPVPAPELDSLKKVFALSKPDTNRVKILLRLGEHQVYKPGEFAADMDSARRFALQAQDLSRKLGYYRGEGRSLNLLGTISRESKDFDQAIAYQRAAIGLFGRQRNAGEVAGSYLHLAHALRDKGEVQQARREVQKAIGICTKNGLLQPAGEAYLELGNTYVTNSGEDLEAKIRCYQQGLRWFVRAGNTRRQADVRKDLGDLNVVKGSHAQALLELRKALTLYELIDYGEIQGVYDLLGYIASRMGDYQEGLRYGLLAVRTAEARHDSSLQLCTIYNRVGLTYFNLRQYQKAYLYYKKSLSVAQKYDHLPSIVILTNNISQVLLQLRRAEEALGLLLKTVGRYPPDDTSDRIVMLTNVLKGYSFLKRYATAQRYCNQLLFISGRIDKNSTDQQHIYKSIIPFFLASKQYGQARIYLQKLELYSRETRNPKSRATAHQYWFQLDSTLGNYLSAIKHHQLYEQLRDSLFNETKSRQIADLEVLHETEQKEKDLQLKEQNIKALTRERQLQNQQMAQDKLVRNAIIGGAVMLTLLLVVLYNRYRLKQRSNKQLKVQQQQLQAQQRQLQAQHAELQVQQQEINRKNVYLAELLTEKDALIEDKEGLLKEKDQLLSGQEQLLEEKERLLREIHHRVKNNLQVIMSLLDSQAASMADKSALSAIRESQHRVQAMALIHQKLYQSEGVARIPMKAYIEEVVAYLSDAYQLSHHIRLELQVHALQLDVTQAVPLGLIINEAITNAFKYAFPGGRAGTVRLLLEGLDENTCQLVIADDGVGLPEGYDPRRRRSLGMTLLHGFGRQLGGRLSITSPPGTTIRLVFKKEQFQPIAAGEVQDAKDTILIKQL
jgi:two-component sensor histidine kinase